MISFKQFLTELFDKPFVWSKIDDLTYQFHTDAGLRYEVSLYTIGAKLWELYFEDENGNYGVTGSAGREALRIFSTVMDCLKDFIKTKKPSNIYFEADKEAGNSRSNIYTKITKRFTFPGYTWTIKDYSGITMYTLDKNI